MAAILDHTLVRCDITTIRDKDTPPALFRAALDRIGYHLAVEALRSVPTSSVRVQTPLQETGGDVLKGKIIVVPILRAGLTLLQPFIHLVPNVAIGYLGMKRNEETLQPYEYYANIPSIGTDDTVVIVDPMLATGGSMCAAIEYVRHHHASNIITVSVIAAPEGIHAVENAFPDVRVICATLDEKLNEHGYIVPGLGDAGDRAHGTL
ncbi:MAG: uracil phosphoribosyltransferase [Candidatus Kapabacteria bacterium]|nr:uracil phosphoribosyltransferase [Candidatus Kapabacteria bacterium]